MSLTDATAAQLQILLHKREVTSEEVTRAYLDRIDALDTQVQAFLVVNADQAMETARNVDRKRLSGEPLGKLAGIPVAVKDVLCVRAEPTTCGSRMLEHYRPPYDAFVVDRLKESDAVIIGKVNMDEFAMGSSTEHSAFQITRNPWDMSCIPNGPFVSWNRYRWVNSSTCQFVWSNGVKANLWACFPLWLGGIRQLS